jgi:protein phosphatase
MRGAIDWYGLSDRGQARETNEDEFLIADLSQSLLIHQTSLDHESHTRLFGGSLGHLLAVADGMGGHSGSQRASAIAIDTLVRYVLGTSSLLVNLHNNEEDDLVGELETALQRCHDSIAKATRVGYVDMGTTLTMAYIAWPRLYVVHAGDSRCYLQRSARLEQITHDHTVAQKLSEVGALDADEAKESRWSHVLWKFLGCGTDRLEPEAYKTTLQLGDTLLLCSDGLSGALGNAQILSALCQDLAAKETCELLVRAANQAGGKDNITVVVARFGDTDRHLKAEQAAAHAAMPAAGEAVAVPS